MEATTHPVVAAIGDDTISKVVDAGLELYVHVYDGPTDWTEYHYLPTGDNGSSLYIDVFEAWEGTFEVSLIRSHITIEQSDSTTLNWVRVGLDGLRSAVKSLI